MYFDDDPAKGTGLKMMFDEAKCFSNDEVAFESKVLMIERIAMIRQVVWDCDDCTVGENYFILHFA